MSLYTCFYADQKESITDVSPPYGGYNRFNALKLGEDYLPIWLQKVDFFLKKKKSCLILFRLVIIRIILVN